uniref:WD repeat-containing protein 63 n=1 Tax=Strigamia maritima TaxID=126957 RepID=T1J6R4_STRMM
MDPETEEVPLSVNAIHLTASDQALFAIVAGKDVTDENPGKYVPGSQLSQDIANRGSKSPFYHLKDDISIIADENLLICYDPKSKLGKNYFLCMSQAANNWALLKMSEKNEVATRSGEEPRRHRHGRSSKAEIGDHDASRKEKMKEVVYLPPVAKIWESRGSDVEIWEEVLKETRPKFVVMFQKELRFYDPNKQIKMMIRKVDDYKMGYVECAPFEDENFALQRIEIDTFVQCANPTRDLEVGTNYRSPTNAWTQTQPRVFSPYELEEEGKSPKLVQFLKTVLQRMLIVLQQNELFNVYYDEWNDVGKVDLSLHGKESSQIKEYQSFSDLKYSKDKMVTCVEWHPTISGILIVSCVTRITFDTRVDKMSKMLMTKYFVLVWSIKDPIHPLLLLQAPDDVQCLAVNPLTSHLLVGGCLNGQIVLWDLTDHMDALRQQKPPTAATKQMQFSGKTMQILAKKVKFSHRKCIFRPKKSNLVKENEFFGHKDVFSAKKVQILAKKAKQMQFSGKTMQILAKKVKFSHRKCIFRPKKSNLVKFVETAPEVISIRWVATSSFEFSHKASVECIQWLPDHFEIDAKGVALVSKTGFCCQILSSGLDSTLQVWDIRPDKQTPMEPKIKAREREVSLVVPLTFQFLESVWRPIYSYEIPGLSKTEKLLCIRFSMKEAQYHRATSQPFDLQTVNAMETASEISKAKTRLYMGTIDGKVGTIDFTNEKDVKDMDGKVPFRPSTFINPLHGGPVISVDRSPFFRNVILTVGMWRFAIWKEEQMGEPLLRLRSPAKRLTAGKWSLVRPAVFFIGKEDGTLDVWDLQEQSHEPVINHTVSAAPISSISLHPRPQNFKDYMLAAADNLGTLHLLILPLYLLNTTRDEMSSMEEYFASEVECWKYRRERREYHRERKEKPTKLVSNTITGEPAKIYTRPENKSLLEQEEAMYEAFKQYLEIEMKFMAEMGLK